MNDQPGATPAPGEARTCVDCGATFRLSAGERQWLARKQLHWPKRCGPCRARRQRERELEREGLQRTLDE
jgi:hypothetical protein